MSSEAFSSIDSRDSLTLNQSERMRQWQRLLVLYAFVHLLYEFETFAMEISRAIRSIASLLVEIVLAYSRRVICAAKSKSASWGSLLTLPKATRQSNWTELKCLGLYPKSQATKYVTRNSYMLYVIEWGWYSACIRTAFQVRRTSACAIRCLLKALSPSLLRTRRWTFWNTRSEYTILSGSGSW